VSAAATPVRPRRRNYRRRRILIETASVALGAVIVIWSLLPVYNMFLVALDQTGHNEFAGDLWPPHPTFAPFVALWTEGVDDVEGIWQQFGNSLYIGISVMVLTSLVGSLAAFAIGRMRLARNWTLTNTALLTYVIPSSTLIIPYFYVMHRYGLSDNPLAVIASEVVFAVPYAILVLQHYSNLIPGELDEAARVDGASVPQIYLYIYLPLIAPALAAVATYALLFSWNDYLYQYVLLTAQKHTTVAVALEQFFDDDDAPWNYMMAIAIVYSVPPIAIFYGLRRYIAAGLMLGGVKG